METAEGGRVQQLCQQQHPQVLGKRAQQQPAQGRQSKTEHQYTAYRKLQQDAAHGQEHQHFGHHPQGPEQADHATAVAQVFKVQGQKGVIRPVAHLHQRHTGIKRQYARAEQLLQEPAFHELAPQRRRLRIRHPQAAQHNAAHDHDHRHRVDIQAQPLEQAPQYHHGKDEADRAPQAYLAVTLGLPTQMGEGDDFKLWQHRMPEERM